MNRSSATSHQRGVGLIEVMIALVVLAVGLLAILGMQISAKQTNYDAVQRTTASHLASDLIERMRANTSALSAYLTGNVLGSASLSAPSPTCASSGASCSASQMAAADLYAWERSLDGASETHLIGTTSTKTGGLVNPTACITGPAGGGKGSYTVYIVWRGASEMEAPTALGSSVCSGGLDGTNKYGSAAAASNDTYRRKAVFTFYVTT